jgi:hypothetical protein
MTSDEHQAVHGADLHVHRLIPGGIYSENSCISLCVTCHGPMPRHAGDLIFKPPSETGVYAILVNLFDPEGGKLYHALSRQADLLGVSVDVVADSVLAEWAGKQPDDIGNYCI